MNRLGPRVVLAVLACLGGLGSEGWSQSLPPWEETLGFPQTWELGGSYFVTQSDNRIYVVGSKGTTKDFESWVGEIDPATHQIIGWANVASPQTARFWPGSCAAYNGYIYTIGGHQAAYAPWNKVEYTKIKSDGTLGPWTETSSLVENRCHAGAVAWGTRLYLVGGVGYQSGYTLRKTVQVAEIHPDGTLGPWVVDQNETAVTHPNTAAVVHEGYIYLIGGSLNDYSTAAVERAEIQADGTLGSWQQMTPLPEARGPCGVAVSGNVLMAWAGTSAYGQNRTDKVWYTTIDESHDLGEWQAGPNLPFAPFAAAGVSYGAHAYDLQYDYGSDPHSTRVFVTSAVPEPSTLVLLCMGTLALPVYAWRRRHQGIIRARH